jgi:DNA-binding NarL/FixJ family response regulator
MQTEALPQERSTRTIRVLIVDDHPIMRVGIAAIINAQPDMEVVGQAGTTAEAVRVFAATQPDLTLMDLRLPDKNGVEAIRSIRGLSPKARIIVLTTYEGDEDIHQALQAGASGYLIKGMPHDALMKALYRVHAGHRFLPQLVTQALSARIPGSNLSQREQEVLQLMFAGKSNREIAEALQIKEATVKSHVSVILMRLNVNDRTQAVVEGLKRGLVHL